MSPSAIFRPWVGGHAYVSAKRRWMLAQEAVNQGCPIQPGKFHKELRRGESHRYGIVFPIARVVTISGVALAALGVMISSLLWFGIGSLCIVGGLIAITMDYRPRYENRLWTLPG